MGPIYVLRRGYRSLLPPLQATTVSVCPFTHPLPRSPASPTPVSSIPIFPCHTSTGHTPPVISPHSSQSSLSPPPNLRAASLLPSNFPSHLPLPIFRYWNTSRNHLGAFPVANPLAERMLRTYSPVTRLVPSVGSLWATGRHTIYLFIAVDAIPINPTPNVQDIELGPRVTVRTRRVCSLPFASPPLSASAKNTIPARTNSRQPPSLSSPPPTLIFNTCHLTGAAIRRTREMPQVA